MKLAIDSRIKLNDNNLIPLLGLGVYQSPTGKITVDAVRAAFEAGYRHIDTARIYGNEGDVGQAFRASGLKREEVFITTKLWNSDQGFESALAACDQSLKRLKLDYLDLYLIHWPLEKKRRDSWRALTQLKSSGKCRSVGVSNYTIKHLEELLSESGVVPAINQVEFSPFLYQQDLWRFCKKHKIQLEAYSPLTRGERLDDERVIKIASKHGKTAAQVLVRWCLEHEIVVIPKSTHEARIKENSEVFDFALDQKDMNILDTLNEDLRTSWDPTDVP